LDQLEEWASDPTWNNHSVAAKHCRVDEDEVYRESNIAHHLVDKSDFIFLKMHHLNHLSDHIHQLGGLLNICYKVSEKAMIDLKQAYPQLNRH